MTRDYPPAGRELDRIVAERVMGYRAVPVMYGPALTGYRLVSDAAGEIVGHRVREEWCWEDMPKFSTDIAAALLVWREVYQRWRRHLCMYAMPTPNGDRIVVDIMHGLHGQASATADVHSEAYAICLAALRALDAAGEG